MNSLHQQVRRTIRRHALCPPGSRLLVGISGGSDSVALAVVLRELSEHGGFSVVSLAHVNHRLRPTAARDEDFCRAFAERLGLPILVEAMDVQAYAISQRLSIEDAARRLRYDSLRRGAIEVSADRVAVGHTRDDQAETFLLKLIRGAGLTGLGGIYPQRGDVIRPLLDVSRSALRDYLVSLGQRWVEDETNDDLKNPRNRIRHRVLPELNLAAGADTSSAIARAAGLVREDGQWLDELSKSRFEALVRPCAHGLEIDAAALDDEPAPIQRRILLKALRMLATDREIGLDHVEAALGVAAGLSGGADLPGGRAELRRGKLVLLEQGPSTK
ncbi:MAG TPA: tRNA lysidine(34) synthetase TilS [Vicinamibacterales bacterium]|nr:tRNA lysidine(34) synthetase TilS [Vicinamibacterales bacterium]